MPALRNARHEAFCRQIVAGKSAAAAYRAAGYKADRRTAWRVRHRPDICRRIDELVAADHRAQRQAMAEALDRHRVTTDAVICELAKIGYANLHDFIEIGVDGEPRINLAAITRDEAAGLQEISIDEPRAGNAETARKSRRIRVKLGDKLSALVALGKHLGIFSEPTLNMNVLNYFSEKPPTMDEWRAEIGAQLPEPSNRE
jgi:phage terminase small subunit